VPKALRISNADIRQGKQVLLEKVNFSADAGEIVSLLGDNGSGKTSFLESIAGLIAMPPAQIYLFDDDQAKLSRQARARILQMLLQESSASPYLTAFHCIAQGLLPRLGFNHWLEQEEREEISALAERLQITHLLERPMGSLSGGESRLIHIAKCFIDINTKIILLDEPSVFLDNSQKKRLAAFLRERSSLKALIIFSSHDNDFIAQCATRALMLTHKKIEERALF
jgi:ABC-type cobalamin/Fe3+-siderophores transport system ATPase subunit